MVTITKTDAYYNFEVKGLHKLWSFRNELNIPLENIVRAYQDVSEMNGWKGWRAPGTHVPFIITAGTYHLDGDKIFWDVVNKKNAIIIELKDENYHKLIVEVDNPTEAMALING